MPSVALKLAACTLLLSYAATAHQANSRTIQDHPRVALVIGNSNYEAGWSPLPNAATQANEMARTLQTLGFSVYGDRALLSLDKQHFKSSINEFIDHIPDGAFIWVYYNGHGEQDAGDNYLIPVDAGRDWSGKLAIYGINLQSDILDKLKAKNIYAAVFVVDACRNISGDDHGMNAPQSTLPQNTLIAFAGQANLSVAGDNPYSDRLLVHMAEQGLSLNEIFGKTYGDVVRAQKGQYPTVYGLLEQDVYLIPADKIEDWNFSDVPDKDSSSPSEGDPWVRAQPYLEKHGIAAESISDGEVTFIAPDIPYGRPDTPHTGTAFGISAEGQKILRQEHCKTHDGIVSFVLRFDHPIKSLSFTRAQANAQTESGIVLPGWDAIAFDPTGRQIDPQVPEPVVDLQGHVVSHQGRRVGEDMIRHFGTGQVGPVTYTLSGPDIQSIKFSSDNRGPEGRRFAAYDSVQISELKITSGPTVIIDPETKLLKQIIW